MAVGSDATTVVWSPEGVSVLYSKDNGNSWQTSVGVPAGAKLAADRVNPKRFYAFASGQFYLSTDNGANFILTAIISKPCLAEKTIFSLPEGVPEKGFTVYGIPLTPGSVSPNWQMFRKPTPIVSQRLRPAPDIA